jgi:hypothetical protein
VLLSPQSTRCQFLRLRLLCLVPTSCDIHIPSIMVASFSVGSRTSVERSPSPAAVLVLSPSQDRSVAFLYHASYSVLHARLVIHVTTWEISKTYKFDRTTSQPLRLPRRQGTKNSGDVHNPSLCGRLVVSMGFLRLLYHCSRGGV